MNESKTTYAEAGAATQPLIYPVFVNAVAALLQAQNECKVLTGENMYLQGVLTQCQGEGEKRIADLNETVAQRDRDLSEWKRTVDHLRTDKHSTDLLIFQLSVLFNGNGLSQHWDLDRLINSLQKHREYMEKEHGLEKDAALWYIEPRIGSEPSYLTDKAKAGGLNPHDAQLLQLFQGVTYKTNVLSASVCSELWGKGLVSGEKDFYNITILGICELMERELIHPAS